MKFEAVLGRWRRRELDQMEAAEILGMTERTFRRWYRRYEEDGTEGLADRRLGKPSAKRVPEGWADRVEDLYRERYLGFNARHFWEHLVKDHGFPYSYSWAKTFLHRRQLVPLTARKGPHRKKRPRRPLIGMMLHQDGSRHRWIPGLAADLDLIVTMDDADSRIYSAFLVEEEGTMSSLRGLREVIERHGLFCALYTDRGSHYFETPQAGGKVDKDRPTQLGRALAQLGIEHIAAYSPEARGRSERMFATLQDRLPKELTLAGITTSAAANRFLDLWAKASMSRCCAATRGQRSRSAQRIVHRSTGRRARQAVLGGTDLGSVEEPAVGGVAGQAAGPVEDGEAVVGIVVDAHLGSDEVRPQRARLPMW